MLMKETEEDINIGKDIPCSWIGRINTVKTTILPKYTNQFSVILIRAPMTFFSEPDQVIRKFVWKYKDPK